MSLYSKHSRVRITVMEKKKRYEKLSIWKSMNVERIKKLHPLEPRVQHSAWHQFSPTVKIVSMGTSIFAALLSVFINVLEKLKCVILLIAHDTLCYWTIKLVKYQGIVIFMKITLPTCELCKHIRDCEKYKFSRIH